jgi:hypothetical protein
LQANTSGLIWRSMEHAHGAQICHSIRARRRLSFEYGGRTRIVEPYCHGFTAHGAERLRAIQVAGESSSGGFGFGKLWDVAKMTNVRVRDEAFVPNDPDYNPDDSALAQIHCRI